MKKWSLMLLVSFFLFGSYAIVPEQTDVTTSVMVQLNEDDLPYCH